MKNVLKFKHRKTQRDFMKNFRICRKLNYAIESDEKKANVDHLTAFIREKMVNAGYTEVLETFEKDEAIDKIDYIFSIGGDGTMLHSMHHHIGKKSIVVGVNAGNVGFLTPYSIQDILSSDVVSMIENQPRIEQRSILEHSFGLKKGVAVNDYAITAFTPNGMIEFSIEVEHRGQVSRAGRYRANALVVSGPCGSTAYNMNAGGAIVDPSVKCMQMVMIAPMTLGARPLIVGTNSIIHVTVHNTAKIFSDGMHYHDMSEDSNKISITLMEKESNILVPNDWNFYSTLAKKLHWNNGNDV